MANETRSGPRIDFRTILIGVASFLVLFAVLEVGAKQVILSSSDPALRPFQLFLDDAPVEPGAPLPPPIEQWSEEEKSATIEALAADPLLWMMALALVLLPPFVAGFLAGRLSGRLAHAVGTAAVGGLASGLFIEGDALAAGLLPVAAIPLGLLGGLLGRRRRRLLRPAREADGDGAGRPPGD